MIKRIFILSALVILILSACSKKQDKESALFNKGKIYFINRDLVKAISCFQEVIKKEKHHYPSYVMIGRAYYYSGDIRKAKEIFKKLLRVNKNSINALNWLARIEGIDENYHEKGLNYLEKVLSMDLDNYDAHFYKALILKKQNKIKEAIVEL
ncbi:MAG: tetratricopeptide repeat protein, partial [Spirochaetes bacterium]|nr:tetratricopeptide repeat protein [Spirochaetota bacterium]